MIYNNIIHGVRSKNIITNHNKKNLIKSKRSRGRAMEKVQTIYMYNIIAQGRASSISSQV